MDKDSNNIPSKKIKFSEYHKKKATKFFDTNLVFSDYHKTRSNQFFSKNEISTTTSFNNTSNNTNKDNINNSNNNDNVGFTFNVNDNSTDKSKEQNDNKWKCTACDEYNDNNQNSCSNCFSNKPGFTPSFNFVPVTIPSDNNNSTFNIDPIGSSNNNSTTSIKNNDPFSNSSKEGFDFMSSNTSNATVKSTDSFLPSNPSSSTTEQSTGGGFTFVDAPSKPKEEPKDKWKCPACEEYNDNAVNSCSGCFSNKPGFIPVFTFGPPSSSNDNFNTTKEKSPPTTPINKNTKNSTNNSNNNTSFPSFTPFPESTSTSTGGFDFIPSNTSSSSVQSTSVQSTGGGFTFVDAPSKPKEEPKDKWKCPACEEYNDEVLSSCSGCFSNKPGFKPIYTFAPPPSFSNFNDEKPVLQEKAPIFSTLPSTPSSSSNNSSNGHWVCSICDRANPSTNSHCSVCNNLKILHKGSQENIFDTKSVSTPVSVSTPLPSSLPVSTPLSQKTLFIPSTTAWKCPTCDHLNDSSLAKCNLCLDPR